MNLTYLKQKKNKEQLINFNLRVCRKQKNYCLLS